MRWIKRPKIFMMIFTPNIYIESSSFTIQFIMATRVSTKQQNTKIEGLNNNNKKYFVL